MIKLTPTALRAFLACPRSWWLSHIARASKEVPAYVMGGRALDQAMQNYLQGTPGADGPDLDATTRSELEALKPELPAPGTVRVQHKMRVPCPGLEDRVIIEATADYVTPPSMDLVVIGDGKRVWSPEAIMTPEELADDIQAQLEAWLVWRLDAPLRVNWMWNYCVRETRNQKTGQVTRKPKAQSTAAIADRKRVDDWFDRVVLQAARDMLDIIGPAEAIAHDPDSCENGGRCFVRAHCALHQGPVKGDIHVDLSRFKTNAAKAAEAIVAEADAGMNSMFAQAAIAINPPPLTVVSRETDTDTIDIDAIEASPEALAQLGIEQVPDTIPAPAPEEPKPARKRRGKGPKDDARTPSSARPGTTATANGQADAPALHFGPTLDECTTEAILDELRDRGYTAVYLERARG